MQLMFKEFLRMMPPAPNYKPKTLEGETVKQIIDLINGEAEKQPGGELFTSIPFGHIIVQADRKPESTRQVLIKLYSILNYYKEKRGEKNSE